MSKRLFSLQTVCFNGDRSEKNETRDRSEDVYSIGFPVTRKEIHILDRKRLKNKGRTYFKIC